MGNYLWLIKNCCIFASVMTCPSAKLGNRQEKLTKQKKMNDKNRFSEIDVIELFRKVMAEKRLLCIYVLVFMILGVIVALSKPKVYTAEMTLAPEMNSGGGLSGSLGDMASSFGIDFSGTNSVDAIYPEIYPTVLASNDFILKLFDVKVRLMETNESKSFTDHLMTDTKSPFWDKMKMWLIGLFKKEPAPQQKGGEADPFRLTKRQNDLCDMIRGAITCLVDKKTSVITIGFSDQDPLVAAIMTDTLQNRLQSYITDYRTKKARKDLEYYTKLYLESHEQYKQAQLVYASYSDNNQDLVLERYRAKRDELENEMQLKYNLYTQMASQYQTARAKVQESTPAFTIIQRPTMPYKASSTPRSLIVFFFIILGVMADAFWVILGRKMMSARKR